MHAITLYKFAVTAPSAWGNGRRTVISQHKTMKAAERALKLAKGNPDFRIDELTNENRIKLLACVR